MHVILTIWPFSWYEYDMKPALITILAILEIYIYSLEFDFDLSLTLLDIMLSKLLSPKMHYVFLAQLSHQKLFAKLVFGKLN